MFWQKKSLSSDEYEKLLKRVIGLEADVGSLRAKIDTVNTLVASLRGLVNRKISGGNSGNEETEERTSESNLNSVLLPE